MNCCGCINYLLYNDLESGVVYFKCQVQDRNEPFPGKGCSGFTPKVDRYIKYNHSEYCQKNGIETE